MTALGSSERRLFGGPGSEEYNALHEALVECAREDDYTGSWAVYDFLEHCPQTTLVVFLVDKLHELGFAITARRDE